MQYEIESNSGLYFEELAELQVSHSEWAFVTHVNLSYFNHEIDHLEKTVGNIQKFCDKIRAEFTHDIPNSNCDHVVPQLHNSLEEIREYSTKWFTDRDYSAESRYENEFQRLRRKKRGFLGTMTKSLFGTLTEDEGQFYMEQINALKSRNIQQIDLNKKQTTIFQLTVNVLNHTMQSQSVQSLALQKYLDDLSFILRNVTSEISSAQVSSVLFSKLSEIMQYASLLIMRCREKQQYFFEAITTKSKSLQLIPPRMFLKELERISLSVVSHGLLLPLALTRENLLKFYQITLTEGRIVDNSLVVRFSIPLVENRRFMLYKATSAPVRNTTDGSFNFIVPHNEYIAYDSVEEKFAILKHDDIKNCHRMHQKLVCKQTFPIMAADNNFGCEINLLRNASTTSACDIRTANVTEELWVQLQQPNTYLYTLPKSVSVTILCSHSRTSLTPQGTGIIAISQSCRIKTERVEIVAFQSMESKIFRSLGVSSKFHFNASAEIGKAKQIKVLRIPDIKLSNAMNEENLKKISQIDGDLSNLQIQNEIEKASAMNVVKAAMNQSGGFGQIVLGIAVITIAIAIIFTCIKRGFMAGGNLIIFVILVTIAITIVLYII